MPGPELEDLAVRERLEPVRFDATQVHGYSAPLVTSTAGASASRCSRRRRTASRAACFLRLLLAPTAARAEDLALKAHLDGEFALVVRPALVGRHVLRAAELGLGELLQRALGVEFGGVGLQAGDLGLE